MNNTALLPALAAALALTARTARKMLPAQIAGNSRCVSDPDLPG